jgi:6-phosphofructokinase 1
VVGKDAAGMLVHEDRCSACLDVIARRELDAVIVAGGDGSMTVASTLVARARARGSDANFIGLPKTIDNDLYGTELTFGFQTAVAIATDALDRVHTTAASHHRVMVVEVMGRNAGWIALHSGVASGADIILIPEIPFSIERIRETALARNLRGKRFTIICVAEGARPAGGQQIVARVDPTSPDPIRLGGVAKLLSDEIEKGTHLESRHVVLGHVQRGGSPVAGDRELATRLGCHAITLLLAGGRNRMVAMQGNRLADIAIEEAGSRQRLITPDDPLLAAARAIGTTFGE